MLIASIVVDCVPRLWDGWIREINIFRECVYNLRWRGCESPVHFDHGIEVSVYFIQRGWLTRATILS